VSETKDYTSVTVELMEDVSDELPGVVRQSIMVTGKSQVRTLQPNINYSSESFNKALPSTFIILVTVDELEIL